MFDKREDIVVYGAQGYNNPQEYNDDWEATRKMLVKSKTIIMNVQERIKELLEIVKDLL